MIYAKSITPEIVAKVKELGQRNLSQRGIAQRAGVSQFTVNMILRGAYDVYLTPKIEELPVLPNQGKKRTLNESQKALIIQLYPTTPVMLISKAARCRYQKVRDFMNENNLPHFRFGKLYDGYEMNGIFSVEKYKTATI